MKLKIHKGANVEVTTGADKGKRGAVLEVDKEKMRIRIEGVKIQTRHSKQNGLVKSEGYIHYSNVKLLDAAKKTTGSKKKKATKEKSA